MYLKGETVTSALTRVVSSKIVDSAPVSEPSLIYFNNTQTPGFTNGTTSGCDFILIPTGSVLKKRSPLSHHVIGPKYNLQK